MLLTEIIASRTGIELDRQVLKLQSDEAVAARERMRLARDLHDGVLQSLTAAVLQLKLLTNTPSEERHSQLDMIKELLVIEQRRVREFVQGGGSTTIAKSDVMLVRDLHQVLSEAAQHWNCASSFSVTPQEATVSSTLGTQLSFMLAEAVANAVRHGGASNIDVMIEKQHNQLILKLRDNGRGFSGPAIRHDHNDLVAAGFGPVSLRARAGDLGGSLALSNSPHGAELEIRVPSS